MRRRLFASAFSAMLLACGGGDPPAPVDAGPSEAVDAGTPPSADPDAGALPEVPDAGPPALEPDAGAPEPDDRLVVCGGPWVMVLHEARFDEGADGAVFRWRAEDRDDLPAEVASRLRGIAECKPLPGSLIAVSSNSGGVAIFDYPSGDVVFHAIVPKAHSVAITDDGHVVVAGASDHDRVALFAMDRPGERLDDDELRAAHGLVWDAGRQLMWASGHGTLRAYAIGADETLRTMGDWTLPDHGAHDLRPVPGSDTLVLSTRRDVHFADRQALLDGRVDEAFTPHRTLQDEPKIKSYDIHPQTGRVAYVQATESFWAPYVELLYPSGRIELPEHRIYKARWAQNLLAR